MKKLIAAILSGIMIFSLGTSVQAEDSVDIPMQKSDILCESSDFEAVKKLESQMLIELKEMYDGLEMPSDFPEKMDFSYAVKIYVDTGIQNFNTDKESEIMENLRQSTYV